MLKASDLLNFQTAFELVMQEKLDFKLSYRLSKIMRKIEPTLKALEETRLKLIEKYGERDKEGKLKQVPTPQGTMRTILKDGFQKDWQELLDQEENVEFEKIPLSLLEAEKDKLTTQVLYLLMPFIEEK
jgi:hypothetical protein